MQEASFLVRPAEGIERLCCHTRLVWFKSTSFLVRPAEGIERETRQALQQVLDLLHSWYDPQRVLKERVLQRCLIHRLLLHSWYDPQRVLKVSHGDGVSDRWQRFIPGTTRRGY